MKFIKVNR